MMLSLKESKTIPYKEEKFTSITSTTPLYPTIAASSEWVIFYANDYLVVFNFDETLGKVIPWKTKNGHVVDMCHFEKQMFVILMKQEIHLLDVVKEKSTQIHRLDSSEEEINYHRCAVYKKFIFICYSHPGTDIEKWSSDKCVNRWGPADSCTKTEHICCLRASSDRIALSIGSKSGSTRIELRNPDDLTRLASFLLTTPCYYFISSGDQDWLLVPYYKLNEIHHLDVSQNMIKVIKVPQKEYSSDQLLDSNPNIWNVTFVPGKPRRILVRYDRKICCYELVENQNQSS